MTELDQTRRTLRYADGEQTLTVQRTFPTTVDDLWDACTDPERIPRWFLPIEGDLRVGGSYRLEGNAHGTIESCDPPHEFSATWEFGGDVTTIRVAIAPDDNGARFILEHTGSTDSEHWRQYGPAAVGLGWDGMLHGLMLHIDSGEAIDPAVAAAWATSDEAKEFTRSSGEQWLGADLAAGTDAHDAKRRAAATVRAYLGE